MRNMVLLSSNIAGTLLYIESTRTKETNRAFGWGGGAECGPITYRLRIVLKAKYDLIFSPLFNAYKKGNKKENLNYQR
jgi:hypothetical protein